MHRVKWFPALALLLFLFVGCESEAQGNENAQPSENGAVAASVQNVNMDRFEELTKDEGVQLLDVRTPGEVAEGMVAGAQHINVHDADFGTRAAAELDKETPVAVYCKSGGRSARAAQTLVDLGFKTVYNYTGGMSEWKSEGKALETK